MRKKSGRYGSVVKHCVRYRIPIVVLSLLAVWGVLISHQASNLIPSSTPLSRKPYVEGLDQAKKTSEFVTGGANDGRSHNSENERNTRETVVLSDTLKAVVDKQNVHLVLRAQKRVAIMEGDPNETDWRALLSFLPDVTFVEIREEEEEKANHDGAKERRAEPPEIEAPVQSEALPQKGGGEQMEGGSSTKSVTESKSPSNSKDGVKNSRDSQTGEDESQKAAIPSPLPTADSVSSPSPSPTAPPHHEKKFIEEKGDDEVLKEAVPMLEDPAWNRNELVVSLPVDASPPTPLTPPQLEGDPRKRAILYYGTSVNATCKREQKRRHPASLCCPDDERKKKAALSSKLSGTAFDLCHSGATEEVSSTSMGDSKTFFRRLRMCKNVFGLKNPDKNEVTLVTQLTTDRLPMLEMVANQYKGPISAVFYVMDKEYDFCALYKLFSSSLNVRKYVYLHIVYSPFHNKEASLRSYPVNVLRNIAWSQVSTPYVFLSDIDMVPSFGLASILKSKLEKRDGCDVGEQCVFVVPAFEVNFDKKKSGYPENVIEDFQWLIRQGLPATKSQLLPYLNSKDIFQVHYYKGKHAHEATDFQKWKTATVPYKVEYSFLFEPYVAGPKSMPHFPPEFAGYGNDKCSQTLLLAAHEYKFIVVEEGFLFHYGHRWPQWKSYIDQQKSWGAWSSFVKSVEQKTGYKLEYPKWAHESARKGELPMFVLSNAPA
uniref:Uncharacterized protein n=1 Tax=Palpitomonas bilix TaxID=652834 RepID=A0A7S3DM86_9EUKA|mmetsp:Transcript_43005/g.111149  ORF Transcript_43005/g.111149 Transcript_43005/m.111149 type:complete len:713 (+) Transcript_43005:163-2301(+)